MKSATILSLSELTIKFYTSVGGAFSKTRQAPWTGWQNILITILPELNKLSKINILDVGCGNGRFCTFIHKSIGNSFYYTGIDSNDQLLQQTKAVLDKSNTSGKTIKLNIIESLLANNLSDTTKATAYTIVSCFGVFHHVPSQELRIKLLQFLEQSTVRNGFVIISLWQFAKLERYANKFLDPQKFGIDAAQLEVGDYLLGWDTVNVARYCHSFSQIDIAELIAATNLQLIQQFTADGKEGRSNIYLVFQKN